MKRILTKKVSSKSISNIDALLWLLTLSKNELLMIVNKIPFSYVAISIQKPDKTFRNLDAPGKFLKKIQKKILDYYIGQIKLPHFVFGIGKNKTILENVQSHVLHKELVVIDIKNFFPSVHYSRVKKLYSDLGCDEEVSMILTKLTTLNYCLPQGAPTSPYIASLCLNNLDRRLFSLCKANRLTYTRYFDDIAISGDKISVGLKSTFIGIIQEEGYQCKKEKIHYYEIGQRRKLTGLIIENGKIDIENKELVLPYLIELKNGGLNKLRSDNPEKERKVLEGKINFIKSILPEYGKKLKDIFEKIEW